MIIGQFKTARENKYEDDVEILFLGSSNVGKSSLINALQGKDVAKVSSKLSKTQAMNRYPIGTHPDSKCIMVDSPGYGYTRTPLNVKKKLRRMIFKHVAEGTRILKIYLLVNGHIGLKSTDVEILEQLNRFKRPIQIVLTKIDKIDRSSDLLKM